MDDQIDHSQVERFKQIAKMMECEDGEKAWDDRLHTVAKQQQGQKDGEASVTTGLAVDLSGP